MNGIDWFDNEPFSRESPQSKRAFLLVILMLLAISYVLALITTISLGVPTSYALKIETLAAGFLLAFSMTLKHLFFNSAREIGLSDTYMIIKNSKGKEKRIPLYEITEVTRCRYPFNKGGKRDMNLLIWWGKGAKRSNVIVTDEIGREVAKRASAPLK